MPRSEFDELTLDDIQILFSELAEKRKERAFRDAQLFFHIRNAPHFTKKSGAYEIEDFLPSTEDERRERADRKLTKTMEALKAMASNQSKPNPKKLEKPEKTST